MKTIIIDDYFIFCNLKRGKGDKIEFQNNDEKQNKKIHLFFIHTGSKTIPFRSQVF